MNYVEPIRDSDILANMCLYLKENNNRNYIMFIMGIYTGLRISDILKLRVKDVIDISNKTNKRKIKKQITLREQKTSKQKIIKINPILREALEEYVQDKEIYEYIIKSRQGFNKPITRKRAYEILKELGDMFNVDCLGCHSMRKTFGYHYYKQTKDIALLQKIFNHSSPAITLAYIGIDQDRMDRAYTTFRYF
ncbi:MAG: site-specific integrase [Paraclostridium sordellii]|uniref:site-specific integrase n=1 Tax=Paraclostridium sordellii TaxID=1505 RepID=UPI000C77535A|nr:site-specific integrase [Paeniclostridium sordellii]AUN12794.1 site-specific integrase [Paeniclostridium sordellii]